MRHSDPVRLKPNKDWKRRKGRWMIDYRDSELLKMLVADGLRAGGAATPKARGRKGRGAANVGARSPVNAAMGDMNTMGRTGGAGGGRGPIYLAWVNPTTMRQGMQRRTSMPSLIVVEGGKW